MSNYSDALIIIFLMIVSFVLSYFGSSVGLMLGQFRLPFLIYALGSPVSATGTNLGISMMGALAGTYFHMREGRVNFRLLFSIGIPSMIGAFLSVLVLAEVKPDWVKILVGFMLIYSGLKITKSRGESNSGQEKKSFRHPIFIEGVFGLALGALSGAVGLMLGSLRLPTMIRVLKIEPKEAVATNLAIGFLTGLVGAVTSLWVSGAKLLIIAAVAPAIMLGSYLGSRFVAKIDPLKLHQLLAWTLVGTGTFMIVESIGRFVKSG